MEGHTEADIGVVEFEGAVGARIGALHEGAEIIGNAARQEGIDLIGAKLLLRANPGFGGSGWLAFVLVNELRTMPASGTWAAIPWPPVCV